MKKVFKVLIFIIILVLIIFIGIYFKNNYFGKEKLNIGKEKLRLVVIGVCDFQEILAVDENGNLLQVRLKELKYWNEMDKFERGQEIEIYYDGVIITTYPGKITNVSSYKILKEKSDIEIPEEVIKRYDNSTKNVMVHAREISNEKLEFRILDTNEISYKYDFDYSLLKKNLENEEYNKKLQEKFKKEQGVDSASDKSNKEVTNSTKPFNPDTSQYKTVWENVNQKEIGSIEEMIKIVDDTPGHFDIEGKFNWNYLYGTLEQGEYQFVLKNKADTIHFNSIVFNFVVDENGEAVCEVPTFEW